MEIKKQVLRVLGIVLMLSVIVPAYGLSRAELRRKCREGKCSSAEKKQLQTYRRRTAAIIGGTVALGAAGAAAAAKHYQGQQWDRVRQGLRKLYWEDQEGMPTGEGIKVTLANLIRLYKADHNQQEPSPSQLETWLESHVTEITYFTGLGAQQVEIAIPRGKTFRNYMAAPSY